MVVLKGRRESIEAAHDHVEAEARRLGLKLLRIVGHRSPDGACEFLAVLA